MPPSEAKANDLLGPADLLLLLRKRWLALIGLPLLSGSVALGLSFLIPPTFTAVTTFLPPQQAQSAMASALSSLGPLAGLAGGGAAPRSSGDQYISLMTSATVLDKIVQRYSLASVYKSEVQVDARNELQSRVRMSLGKKDGLVSIEVDDTDPARAARIANQFVDELRQLTSNLAVTEAQQRRQFFEVQLRQTRDKLAAAQQALTTSGFSASALRAEPKAAAEGYGRLKAEVAAAEVQVQALRRLFADGAPEVQRAQATLSVLRQQLGEVERTSETGGADYVGKYREYKYQEALFELFARQYEMARVDEAKEGAFIQVIDPATPPERKSKPKRATIAIGVSLATGLLVLTWVLWAGASTRKYPGTAHKLQESTS